MLFPLNPVGQSPTVALEKDLELIEWIDRWGFAEAWVGEHHSGGFELVSSPELFLAFAAERTKHIRLGTGVLSVPYHNPFMTAQRMVLLDHLSRGRVMFGFGPGQLASDARMLGIEAGEQRRMMREGIEVILSLLTGEEPVTFKSDWCTLNEARLQIAPYTQPLPEMAVAASISPAGPATAGRHGLGLLSIAAWHPDGFGKLRDHWSVVEEQAALHGKTVDRANWRMMAPVHIARTEAEARENVKHGLGRVFDYLSHIIPLPTLNATTFDDLIDQINGLGGGVIGTPAMAVDTIGRLQERSGGFGCYMLQGAELANRRATLESYQIFAEEVAPHFQGQLDAPVASNRWLMEWPSATPGMTQWVSDTTGAIRREIQEYERSQPDAVDR
ncbi:LLM class flavin-dependent oxidoreductase [Dactylosporangium sp. CA-139114]|uniref:LLM class flavin-dependent oxidoreductase n=1 Tax=Dactylosporangium sp. CA-139114 TaxID=3239931 RepID=UPI003D96BE42